MIPEAVLGTKEPSEKARLAAFDLVVAMGNKMAGGGVVKRNLVDGMDDDSNDAPEGTCFRRTNDNGILSATIYSYCKY